MGGATKIVVLFLKRLMIERKFRSKVHQTVMRVIWCQRSHRLFARIQFQKRQNTEIYRNSIRMARGLHKISFSIIVTNRELHEKFLDDEYAKMEQIREEQKEKNVDAYG
jgi:hypothetical protein